METQETKIRRGQAFNLAVADAIQAGQSNNPNYIYKKYIYFHHLADIVQGSDIEMIQEVVDSKDFNEVMKLLSEAMK